MRRALPFAARDEDGLTSAPRQVVHVEVIRGGLELPCVRSGEPHAARYLLTFDGGEQAALCTAHAAKPLSPGPPGRST